MQAAAASMHVKKNSEMREVYSYYIYHLHIIYWNPVLVCVFFDFFPATARSTPKKRTPLLKGGTIDHPLHKHVVPPDPIEA